VRQRTLREADARRLTIVAGFDEALSKGLLYPVGGKVDHVSGAKSGVLIGAAVVLVVSNVVDLSAIASVGSAHSHRLRPPQMSQRPSWSTRLAPEPGPTAMPIVRGRVRTRDTRPIRDSNLPANRPLPASDVGTGVGTGSRPKCYAGMRSIYSGPACGTESSRRWYSHSAPSTASPILPVSGYSATSGRAFDETIKTRANSFVSLRI
jgi:hypothetical protein